MNHLDQYEQDILNSVENGEWVSTNNTKKRLRELQASIKH